MEHFQQEIVRRLLLKTANNLDIRLFRWDIWLAVVGCIYFLLFNFILWKLLFLSWRTIGTFKKISKSFLRRHIISFPPLAMTFSKAFFSAAKLCTHSIVPITRGLTSKLQIRSFKPVCSSEHIFNTWKTVISITTEHTSANKGSRFVVHVGFWKSRAS